MTEKVNKKLKEPLIVKPEADENLVERVVEIIAKGEIIVMQVAPPMYGYVADVEKEKVVKTIWNLKGRPWIERPIKAEETIEGRKLHKPVTAVTRERFEQIVDWNALGFSIEDSVTEVLLKSKLHLIFPVKENVVPTHLFTLHGDNGEIPTLSMVVTDERISIMGAIVSRLERDHPEIIVGGSSANIQGSPVFIKANQFQQALVEKGLGEKVRFIIQGQDRFYNGNGDREELQLGMALVLPKPYGIRIYREGIGAVELREQLFQFPGLFQNGV